VLYLKYCASIHQLLLLLMRVLQQVQGKYQVKPPLPFAPGGEVAGFVKAVGSGVNRFKVDDRVIAFCGWGGFATEVAVKVCLRFGNTLCCNIALHNGCSSKAVSANDDLLYICLLYS
jgi:D-arabinose 1-dehydrogenase-like Zn-dependent alcohol dehydrogenase